MKKYEVSRITNHKSKDFNDVFGPSFKNDDAYFFSIWTAEQDDLAHARSLFEILTDSESPDLKDLKMSVAVYCKQVYRVIS